MLKKLSVEVNIIILIKINLYMDKIFYIYMNYNLFYLKKYKPLSLHLYVSPSLVN